MKPGKTQVRQGRRPAAHRRQDAPVEAVAEVSRNRALSEKMFLLDLRVSMPAARPGQFVMLGLPGRTAPPLRRPFSVLSHDSSRKSLEILYSVEGSGTQILSGLGRGQELSLLGPLGNGFHRAAALATASPGLPRTPHPRFAPAPSVLVAGGRGIAPLIFFADSIASSRKDSSSPVLFLAGARTAAELVLLDRVKATEVFVSTDDGSVGKKGTVIQLLSRLGREIDFTRGGAGRAAGVRVRPVLYGCGPTEMLKALHSYAVSEGLLCYVSLEARMACGVGVCQGCKVRSLFEEFKLTCKDGPVFVSRWVNWAEYEGA